MAIDNRPGSVLVLVVAMLVLLALVATAFLTTTRLDRQAAVQHGTNVQKEFIFETGLVYVQSELISDILDPGAIQAGQATTVRTPSSITAPSAYKPIDAPLADPILAPREPFLQFTWPLTAGSPAAFVRPMWRTVSWPTFTSAERSLGVRYEPPDNNRLVRSTPNVLNVSPDPGPISLVEPYEDGKTYLTGQVVMVAGPSAGSFDYYVRTEVSAGTPSNSSTKPRDGYPIYPLILNGALWEKCDPKQFLTFAPSTVTTAAGKTYPAFYIYNNYVAKLWRDGNWNAARHARYVTGPVLAADADGDGIADSLYRKLPVSELAGITYYMAVRVLDHNSAVNLNTAWASTGIGYDTQTDGDFVFDYGAPWNVLNRTGFTPNFGMFPGNVGLRDMMLGTNQPRAIGAPSIYIGEIDNIQNDMSESAGVYFANTSPFTSTADMRLAEMSLVNRYRFGYDLNSATFAMSLGTRSVEDFDAGSGNWTFQASGADFFHRTQTEAHYFQALIRPRYTSKGDNAGPGGTPEGSINNLDTTLRWFDLSNDGAALAYRGGTLVNIDTAPNTLEQMFITAGQGGAFYNLSSGTITRSVDSLYNSAGNRLPSRARNSFVENPAFEKNSYPVGATNPNTGVNTSVDAWFDLNFNYDRYYESTPVARFIADPPNAQFAFYRSLRPLLVTSSGVSNVIGPRTINAGVAEVPEEVTDVRFDPVTGGTYSIAQGLAVSNPQGSAYPIAKNTEPSQTNPPASPAPAAAELAASVGTFSIMTQYTKPGDATAMSTTQARVSANTASFGDLWRAFWSTMIEDPAGAQIPTVANRNTFVDSGSPFERVIEEYEQKLATQGLTGALLNPYWGSRFNSSGSVSATINDFRPATTATTINPATGTTVAAPVNQSPFAAQPPDENGYRTGGAEIEYNPMRMFRSPIRSFVLNGAAGAWRAGNFVPPFTPQPTAPGFDPNVALPHLRPDQVMLLRAALASVNAEDLRDNDFKVTRRTIKLRLSGQANQYSGATPAAVPEPEVAVTVNGFEPQPFITEVFAHTDTVSERTVNVGSGPNPRGYIAIELHNPYPFPIDIEQCKIGRIRRLEASRGEYPGVIVEDLEELTIDPIDLSTAQSNLNGGATYTPPTVIPAGGYLVLENYRAAGASTAFDARYRPDATRLQSLTVGGASAQGAIDSAVAGPRVNFAWVANLHQLFNHEFVLLRPVDVASADNVIYNNAPYLNGAFNGFVWRAMTSVDAAAGAESGGVRVLRYDDPDEDPAGTTAGFQNRRTRAVDMVPLDSFDLTGLFPSSGVTDAPAEGISHLAAGGQARAWHYVRRNDAFTATAPPSVSAGAWSFVYPGRYDATKTTAGAVGFPVALPRQQGTQTTAFWTDSDNSAATIDPWQGGGPQALGLRPVGLGQIDAAASYRYPFQTGQFERGEFAIPLAARGFAPMGVNPLAIVGVSGVPSFFPALETNRSTATFTTTSTPVVPLFYPFGGFARQGDLLEIPFIGSYRIQMPTHIGNNTGLTGLTRVRDVVIELNSITMDAAMAEDTDVNNDPIVGPEATPIAPDTGSQSREQIGRFVPLRKTWLPVGPTLNADNNPTYNGGTALTQFEPMDYWNNVTWLTGSGRASVLYDDMVPDTFYGTTLPNAYAYTNLNRYRWAADLFDFLTVRSTPDDFVPNVTPSTVKSSFATAAAPIKNTPDAAPNTAGEVNQPIEGLVNINTASERVLAMLPWVPDGKNLNQPAQDWLTFSMVAGVVDVFEGANGVPDNLEMARAIVRFREGYAARNTEALNFSGSDYRDNVSHVGNFRSQPFLTMWDLYRVPEFHKLQSLLIDPTYGNDIPTKTLRYFLDDRMGDLSPYPHPFFNGSTSNFAGKFFAPGDRVIDNNAGFRYECIVAHKSDSSNQPPNTMYWRVETSGLTRGFSRARFDYEEQALLLTRVSNLITTRSDVFTAYILLEGWQNAGTPNAELRVSRRQAYFLDRSQTAPGRLEMKSPVPIPTE